MNARQAARCRIYLVTYHALPGPAVGGLRLSALAEYLAGEGLDVSLFSAREKSDGSARTLDARIRRYQIPDRRLWRKASLRIVRSTRYVLGLLKIVGLPSETNGSPIDATSSRPKYSLAAKIRLQFFRVAHAPDANKWWSVKLLARLALASVWGRPAVVIASGPPYSHLAAASLFSRLFSIPIIMDLRDPWYGRAGTSDYAGIRADIDRLLERFCLEYAAAVTTTAPSLASLFRERYPTRAAMIGTILNGFDPEMIVDGCPPVGALRLLFAGTIYQNRSPMPLLQGIVRLVNTPSVDVSKVRLVMAGSCVSWRNVHLPDWVRSAGIESCVEFIGPVSRDEVRRLIVACNVLINFAQGQKQQIPAKLFEHVASRRQVLLFAEPDSDSALVARELRAFLRVDDSVEEVTEALRSLYARYVTAACGELSERAELVETLSRRETNRQFHRLIKNVITDTVRFEWR